MSLYGKIPPNLIPAILEKNGEGWGATRIAAWLLETHKIQVSDNAVSKRLQKERKERQLMSSVIIHDKLSKVLTADLDKVAGVIDRALEDELRSRAKAWGFVAGVDKQPGATDKQIFGIKEGEVAPVQGSEQWSRLMTAAKASRSDLMSALELRLKLCGVDKDGKPQPDSAVVRDQLMNKIDTLLQRYQPKTDSSNTSDSVH